MNAHDLVVYRQKLDTPPVKGGISLRRALECTLSSFRITISRPSAVLVSEVVHAVVALFRGRSHD